MKNNEFNEIISLLIELHKEFPSYSFGQHISTAFDGEDVWGVSNKQLLFELKKYKTELELDVPHIASDEDIQEIIKGGMHLYEGISSNEEEY